jgi:hypothetical protein
LESVGETQYKAAVIGRQFFSYRPVVKILAIAVQKKLFLVRVLPPQMLHDAGKHKGILDMLENILLERLFLNPSRYSYQTRVSPFSYFVLR